MGRRDLAPEPRCQLQHGPEPRREGGQARVCVVPLGPRGAAVHLREDVGHDLGPAHDRLGCAEQPRSSLERSPGHRVAVLVGLRKPGEDFGSYPLRVIDREGHLVRDGALLRVADIPGPHADHRRRVPSHTG